MTLFVPVWIGPRGVAALVVTAVAAGAATVVVAWPVVAAVCVAVVLAALAADAASIGRAPQIARIVPQHCTLGRRASFAYDVRNRGSTALRCAIYEAPVDRLQVDISPARITVAPGGRATAEIGVLPRERGRTQTGVAFVWYESRLGLIRRRMRVGTPEPLRIRPDLGAFERGTDLAQRARLIEAGLRRVRRRGVGSDFESLREYASGDPFRAIDWNATARRGKVMVAQYEVERSQQIIVAIDAGRLMSPRLGDRRKLDYAVSAALTIAAVAQFAADRVGLHAFAAETLAAIAPRSGARHIAALTDALADLEPRFEESDYERAALELRRRLSKRSLIVMFTDLFDPIASSAVFGSLTLLVPQHLVLVVLMNDAAIAGALAAAPVAVSAVYRAAVATSLAAERARAVALLRGRGIGVVDVPAAELSVALLDAYVDVKTRSLL